MGWSFIHANPIEFYKHAALPGLNTLDTCCYKHAEEAPKQTNPTGLNIPINPRFRQLSCKSFRSRKSWFRQLSCKSLKIS